MRINAPRARPEVGGNTLLAGNTGEDFQACSSANLLQVE